MIKQEYIYNAFVTAVYDGDTITVDIDLGFGVQLKDQKVRLYGINAPEMKLEQKAAGTVSRDWLASKILNQNVVIQTYKDKKEKYGRWLAEVYVGDLDVNQQMVLEGLAVKFMDN